MPSTGMCILSNVFGVVCVYDGGDFVIDDCCCRSRHYLWSRSYWIVVLLNTRLQCLRNCPSLLRCVLYMFLTWRLMQIAGVNFRRRSADFVLVFLFYLVLEVNCRLQVAARSSSILPGQRLPADRGLRTSAAPLRSCQHPHCSEIKHSTWRQEFLSCGSENLEQSTRLTAATWHWIWTL